MTGHEANLEERLDDLFVSFQKEWTAAEHPLVEQQAAGSLIAMQRVYDILGLETP